MSEGTALMKVRTEPVAAVKAFGVLRSEDPPLLTSTGVEYTYESTTGWDAVPPYTADEWEELEGLVHMHHEYMFLNIRQPINAPVDVIVEILHRYGLKRIQRFLEHPSILQGFHAWRSHEVARAESDGVVCKVFGDVSLTGRVVEYEKGYRAQGIEIKKLYVLDDEELAEGLSQRYSIPVEVEKWTSDEKSKSGPWWQKVLGGGLGGLGKPPMLSMPTQQLTSQQKSSLYNSIYNPQMAQSPLFPGKPFFDTSPDRWHVVGLSPSDPNPPSWWLQDWGFEADADT